MPQRRDGASPGGGRPRLPPASLVVPPPPPTPTWQQNPAAAPRAVSPPARLSPRPAARRRGHRPVSARCSRSARGLAGGGVGPAPRPPGLGGSPRGGRRPRPLGAQPVPGVPRRLQRSRRGACLHCPHCPLALPAFSPHPWSCCAWKLSPACPAPGATRSSWGTGGCCRTC